MYVPVKPEGINIPLIIRYDDILKASISVGFNLPL